METWFAKFSSPFVDLEKSHQLRGALVLKPRWQNLADTDELAAN